MKKNIKKLSIEANFDGKDITGKISDGYHTFDELYDHRVTLYIALCKIISKTAKPYTVWRSKTHSDGSKLAGWYVLGINRKPGKQITYHLPLSRWKESNFAKTFELAPKFDGHTPENVIKRLKKL